MATSSPLTAGRADQRPLLTLGLAFLAAMFDGYDGQAIGFVSPAIAKDWHLPVAAFGNIFSIGLVGLILGAVILAPAGDRFGRRLVAILGALFVTIFTLATAFVQTPVELALARLLTGFGLGALMPILVTITHEVAPVRRRGLYVTCVVTAFPFGSFVGGMLVASALVHSSWREVFLVSGLISVAFPILFWLFLKPVSAVAPGSRLARVSVAALFRDKRALGTTLLWVVFFVSLLNTYSLGAWLPLLLERGGMTAVDAVRATANYGLGGTIGGLVLGYLTGRLGGGLLAICYLVAAAALIALGIGHGGFVATALLVTLIGAMIPGGHVGNSVIAARLYPAEMNATGLGWTQGIGRVGCVVGPALIGFAAGRDIANAPIFAGAAVFALIGTLAAWWLAHAEKAIARDGTAA